MQYRPLGESGISASVVGIGTWAMGGWMWGGTDERESINAIHAAIDAGINLVDTAPIYGFGLSEKVVGKAIADRRDKVVLATKCGMVSNTRAGEFKFRSNAQGPDADGMLAIQIYLDPESIRAEVELSLRRLKTDYIDLYQPHWQEETTAIDATMGVLMDLKKEGKIRAIGVCNAEIRHLDAYRAAGQLDSDQEKYSMLDRKLEDEQLPYCQKNNVAVLAYSPLVLGLLTEKTDPEREFGKGDQREGNPRFSRENRQLVQEMQHKRFKPIADKHGLSLAQLTIAWTVHQPGLSHALVGARNPQQAQANASAGAAQLSGEDLQTINDALNEYRDRIV